MLIEAHAFAHREAHAVADELRRLGAEVVQFNIDDPAYAAEATNEQVWSTLTGYVSLRTIDGPHVVTPAAIRRLRMTLRKTSTYLPDTALAERAKLGLEELEDYYADLLHLDDPDPATGLLNLRDEQEVWLEALRRTKTVHIQGDGTDLHLRTDGRSWVNSFGKRNVPSGEMYTSPLEDSAEGVVRFDVPSHTHEGRVSDVHLEFRKGVVVSARASEGDATLQDQLERDPGARRLGELGIGGNRRMTRFLGATLFDEKVAGTVHLALGRSYPQTGGRNDSQIHWDLIKDLRGSGSVTLDGHLFQENGVFVGV